MKNNVHPVINLGDMTDGVDNAPLPHEILSSPHCISLDARWRRCRRCFLDPYRSWPLKTSGGCPAGHGSAPELWTTDRLRAGCHGTGRNIDIFCCQFRNTHSAGCPAILANKPIWLDIRHIDSQARITRGDGCPAGHGSAPELWTTDRLRAGRHGTGRHIDILGTLVVMDEKR